MLRACETVCTCKCRRTLQGRGGVLADTMATTSNDARRKKTRFYVPLSMKHYTRLKRNLSRYLFGLIVLVVFLGHEAGFYSIGFISRLDAIVYDARLRLTMPGGIDERIVVLNIDEKSLAKLHGDVEKFMQDAQRR